MQDWDKVRITKKLIREMAEEYDETPDREAVDEVYQDAIDECGSITTRYDLWSRVKGKFL